LFFNIEEIFALGFVVLFVGAFLHEWGRKKGIEETSALQRKRLETAVKEGQITLEEFSRIELVSRHWL